MITRFRKGENKRKRRKTRKEKRRKEKEEKKRERRKTRKEKKKRLPTMAAYFQRSHQDKRILASYFRVRGGAMRIMTALNIS